VRGSQRYREDPEAYWREYAQQAHHKRTWISDALALGVLRPALDDLMHALAREPDTRAITTTEAPCSCASSMAACSSGRASASRGSGE
jgi:hypothetical protein